MQRATGMDGAPAAREGPVTMATDGEPCVFVIFGVTGNLASTQLLPALYALDAADRLPPDLRLIAFARRDWDRDAWRRHVEEVVRAGAPRVFNAAAAARFAQRFDYVRGDLHDAAAYSRLREAIERAAGDTRENTLSYLAIKPGDFDDVIAKLAAAGISRGQGLHRIVVEKPFGVDLASAERLNALLHRHYDEAQIYRIDHYLGKETVQNLFVFRFANMLVEPIWNRNYVDHVQITVAEAGGIDGRADYYDGAGALRDMVQNHLLQMMAVVAMEPPARFEAEALRDEKVKVLRSVRPLAPEAVERDVVRAQYAAGAANGERLAGYREEPGVAPGSTTETFVAAAFHIDNWRWRGVPFCLRTGKRLAQKTSLIALRLRRPPQLLFRDACGALEPNWIVLSIQPEEGMHVEIHAKQPGLALTTRTRRLDASYRAEPGAAIEAYQRLLLDAIDGDRSLFLRFDEVEWAWRAIDPILRRWRERPADLPTYPAGSWGPEEAGRVLGGGDREWRNHP